MSSPNEPPKTEREKCEEDKKANVNISATFFGLSIVGIIIIFIVFATVELSDIAGKVLLGTVFLLLANMAVQTLVVYSINNEVCP